MNRLEQLFVKLGYSRENGLFYLSEANSWVHKFSYRISKVLRDIIQPYAFYSLHHHGDAESGHPEPINNPLILFFDNPSKEKRLEIPKWTFCFGQAPVIIINNGDIKPLDIYHGYQFDNQTPDLLQKINAELEDFSLVNLTLGKTWKKLYHSYFKNVPKVDTYLLNNIIDARRILIAKDGYRLEPKIANRLIGRLLFVRYLIDRKVAFNDQSYVIGNSKQERQESLNGIIKSKTKLYEFFHYLTNKYNGDLFPLQEYELDEETGELIESYNEEKYVHVDHLQVLYHLFSASSFFKTGSGHKSGYLVQPSLFKVYDFEVIPVELISNIYENFIGKTEENINVELNRFKRTKQFEIKAYYTPPFLVDYILSQTITPFLQKQSKATCKVLDPACGSGIFLVESLRKIIEKEIQITSQKKKQSKISIANERLWEILHNNIFGIDIDNDAIEITIFSLYITLLDYKTPIEIEHFKFEELKNRNLFGGVDFFDENSLFNTLFQNETQLDFIIGNPPWGKVEVSQYIDYIKRRNVKEEHLFKETNLSKNRSTEFGSYFCELEIGNKEIAQAFLVRVSDIIQNDAATKCAFIVTGKCFYNVDNTTKQWRKFFLSRFTISQLVDLSGVNNKIVGGNQIFEGARQSAAVVFFSPITDLQTALENVITHIAVKPNRFFNYFRTIVIEKHDMKQVLQRHFMEDFGGQDWLWKVLLHGNVLDYFFMKRLKENYPTLGDFMDKNNMQYNGGLKLKDGQTKKSTNKIKKFKFIEIETRKELQPFHDRPSLTWDQHVKNLIEKYGTARINKEGEVGYLPDIFFFQGEKALLKKGLQAADDFKAVAAYSSQDVVFTDSVCSIKFEEGKVPKNSTDILRSLVGLINSKFFTYFIYNRSSSAGVDRTRAYFEEFFLFPIVFNKSISSLVSEIEALYEENDFLKASINDSKAQTLIKQLDKLIFEAYSITDTEASLIDYAINISLPVLKRAEESGYNNQSIFNPLSIDKPKDIEFLTEYCNVFIEHFQFRFNSEEKYFYTEVYITPDFVGINFIVDKKPITNKKVFFKVADEKLMLSQIGNLGIYNVTRDLYIQQDVRGFNKNTFYIIKPNEKKCWHKAVAYHDLMEFIEVLADAEIKRTKHLQL